MSEDRYIVCVVQPRGIIEVVGSYGDSGEASRACNSTGAGAHIVLDRAVLRFHPRTDKRTQGLVEKALRERKHPALTYAPPPTVRVSAEQIEVELDVDDGVDDAEPVDEPKEERAAEPSTSAAPVSAPDVSRVYRGGRAPDVIEARGRTLTRARWASELGVTEKAIYLSVRKRGGTWADDVERRLALRDATGSTRDPNPVARRASKAAPSTSKTPSPKADADGTLADLHEILRLATEHGGLRELLANAELGLKVRTLTEEARG